MLSALNLQRGDPRSVLCQRHCGLHRRSVANTVESTTVAATRDANDESNDRVSIMKGTTSYANGAAGAPRRGTERDYRHGHPDGRHSHADLHRDDTPRGGGPGHADGAVQQCGRRILDGPDQLGGDRRGHRHVAWRHHRQPTGRVTVLDLSSNNLRGTLPADLGTLTNLITLNLSDNSLTGAIPGLHRPHQPDDPAARRQPVERNDPGLAERPHQPDDAESRREPVDGDNPGGLGRAQPTGSPEP